MTVALVRGRVRGRASVAVMAAVAAVVFGALVTVSVVAERDSGSRQSPSPRVSSAAGALVAYADAIHPGAELAGRVIVNGIRPDIADFEAGRISVAVWNLDMRTRQRELTAAQAFFDDAVVPQSVGDAPVWFRRAFADYQRAVRLFLAAGATEGAERAALIDHGASAGEAGDRAFDRGTARIQAARRALGLGADSRFSDTAAD